MANIVKDGMNLKVGKDFVDAVTLKVPASRGELQINNKARFNWESSLPIDVTESVLRQAAREDGVKITLFISQAA